MALINTGAWYHVTLVFDGSLPATQRAQLWINGNLDITGGFTTTARSGPQAFKVLPVVVYRVYADGRPDELVRGVDIVGTPLSCFSQIICTGDDPAVFNGTCGAESGWVPVSAISSSILVRQIEVEKRERSQERLPILPSPNAGKSAAAPATAAPASPAAKESH